MKLVVLDSYTTTRDGLTWDCLKKYGDLEVYDWTTPEQLMERAQGADALFSNKVKISRETMLALPSLKYIGLLSTGMDHVDLDAAAELGIKVTNVPSYAQNSVPQLTFALILELCYSIRDHVDSVMKEKAWSNQEYNTYWTRPLIGLAGKTLGVIGMGKIGRNAAAIGQAFGMNILAYDVFQQDIPGVKWETIENILKESDFISLHCPLTKETDKLINKETLKLVKPTAYIVNTSRGGLIDEPALIEALNEGRLAGAGLDVMMHEPPQADDPLLTTKNLLITPHIGWATLEARSKIISIVEENLKAFLDSRN